ncbi:hypothetical protein B0J14DRAFT_661148 [Halenospora varia]|nr:hypothetical protein B0J14DRAFT_661148 [Halenospora varia]
MGELLMTDAGVPVVATVLKGEVYINNAKVLERDDLMVNGVFHVIDDALNPYNITAPSKKTNQTASSTAHAATSTSTVSKPKKFSTAAEVKVGIFVLAAGIFFIVTAHISSPCLRKRNMGTLETEEQDGSRKLVELSSGAFYELHQLETREQAVELPERKHHLVELPAGDPQTLSITTAFTATTTDTVGKTSTSAAPACTAHLTPAIVNGGFETSTPQISTANGNTGIIGTDSPRSGTKN